MKRFLATMLFMFSIVVHAQKDVTQFLGIPVDGSKFEMIHKLKEKGYRTDPYNDDILVGEFNGSKVRISVVTNNDKVCRIVVNDYVTVDEASIKIRFNNLCEQFANNPKYVSLEKDYTIPKDEDISYEISVHNKRYEAVFYQQLTQQPTVTDSLAIIEKLKEELPDSLFSNEETFNILIKYTMELYLLEQYSKKIVWFMISDYYGEYGITMYYDNEYNRAHGEDL